MEWRGISVVAPPGRECGPQVLVVLYVCLFVYNYSHVFFNFSFGQKFGVWIGISVVAPPGRECGAVVPVVLYGFNWLSFQFFIALISSFWQKFSVALVWRGISVVAPPGRECGPQVPVVLYAAQTPTSNPPHVGRSRPENDAHPAQSSRKPKTGGMRTFL